MNLLDKLFEQKSRQLAQHSSRRGLLKTLGGLLVGAGTIPLLPVARATAAETPARPQEQGDPASCDYWRYCAIDGFLCSCCGGTHNACPPGTEQLPAQIERYFGGLALAPILAAELIIVSPGVALATPERWQVRLSRVRSAVSSPRVPARRRSSARPYAGGLLPV